MQNALKSNEWERIWVNKTFKIELQKGGPNIRGKSTPDPRNEARSIEAIQLFCKIGFPPHPLKLSPLLNLREFQKTGEK